MVIGILAKEVTGVGVGYGTDWLSKKTGLNQSQSIILGMITSYGTSKGLNALDTKFNVSGMYSKASDDIPNLKNTNAPKLADIDIKGGSKSIDYVKLCNELGNKIKSDGYKIIDTKLADVANSEWADMGYNLPPVAKNTKAYDMEAGDFEYARVFKDGKNNPASPFILRVDDIRGLSAAEIAQKYALPQVPDRIVYPHFPSDTPLEVSIVGPQKKWRTFGGDAQYAIKDVILDDDWFNDIHILD